MPVLRADWLSKEAPAALCFGCLDLIKSGRFPWPMVRMLYLLRCQMAATRNELELMKRTLSGLMDAQKELEQMRLQR